MKDRRVIILNYFSLIIQILKYMKSHNYDDKRINNKLMKQSV